MQGKKFPFSTLSFKKISLLIWVVALLTRLFTALPLQQAGYLDAFYYYHIALNMANGEGITENIIWNYLDDPQTLPRPGNQYWMPMTNFWAAASIFLFRDLLGEWRAAQLPFILVSALLAPLAAWISWHEWQRRKWALSSGILTIFSSFYFIYWVVPDSFTPFALCAAITFLAIWQAHEKGWWWAAAGAGAGMSHLTRVDGLLFVWLIGGMLAWRYVRGRQRDLITFARFGLAAATGYLLVMAPWFIHNWLVTGTPFPGGGTQTLWLHSYNELFAYQPNLTFENYLAWGIGPILRSKATSIAWSILIVSGSTLFYLLPFILIELRDASRRPLFHPVLLYIILLLTTMPLIFTFPATRGSLFHSSAALVPWMMALVPPGIEKSIKWIARYRYWNIEQAANFLGGGFVFLAMLFTLYLYIDAIWLPKKSDAVIARWNERLTHYQAAEAWLESKQIPKNERIFVADPAGYYVTTARPALVIPSDGTEQMAQAARDWQAPWLLLDANYRTMYKKMYDNQQGEAGWQPVATFEDALGRKVLLFQINVK